jgi:hypothetical protein
LPDTPENVRVFGKRHSPRGTSAWPQARVVAISECATHAGDMLKSCGLEIS